MHTITGEGTPTTTVYAMPIIKTSILFLNDRRLEVRTACERKPTRDTPTAKANTNQANTLNTPMKRFLIRYDVDIKAGAHCAQMDNDIGNGKCGATATDDSKPQRSVLTLLRG